MRLTDLAEVMALAQERAEITQLARRMQNGVHLVEVEYSGEGQVRCRLPMQIHKAIRDGALQAYARRLEIIERRLSELRVVIDDEEKTK